MFTRPAETIMPTTMAVLNNLREVKDWISTSKPYQVPEWQIELLRRAVPSKGPRPVIPGLAQTITPSHTRTNDTNASKSILAKESYSNLGEKALPSSTKRTIIDVNGPETYSIVKSPPSSFNLATTVTQEPTTRYNERLENNKSLKANEPQNILSDDIEIMDDELDTWLSSGNGFRIPTTNSTKTPQAHAKPSSSTETLIGSAKAKLPKFSQEFSIIDPAKLGLADLMKETSFKERATKKPRLETSNNTIPSLTQKLTLKGLTVRDSVFSQLENMTKPSQHSSLRPESRQSQPDKFKSSLSSSQMHASETFEDTNIFTLQNYIRYCEAKIKLLTKRNSINESTSLSLDTKLHWIKDKFEPRMNLLEATLQKDRKAFTFLNIPTDLDAISNDTLEVQLPLPSFPEVQSSPPLARSRSKTPMNTFSDENSKPIEIEIEDSLGQDRHQSSLPSFQSNIEEARRVIQQNRANPPVQAHVSAFDDDEEDDFGAQYLDGLVSSQNDSDATDLSGFIVTENGGGRDNDLESVDNTYIATQGTQNDSEVESEIDQMHDEAPERDIFDEVDDIRSQTSFTSRSNAHDHIAIEISDEEENGSTDFTTQLNENRDDIVHIPSENELEADDLNGLQELLYVKLEKSQRLVPQWISDNDFSDDDEELIQLTKTVLPTSSDPPSQMSGQQKNERRVIPGAEAFIDEIYHVLNKTFGLKSFRPNQLEAVVSTLQAKDVFVLLPTGGGKSLCFQLPALVKGGKTCGVTVVVSPLISLMQDQVQHLLEKNIRAGMISSKGSADERNATFKSLTSGQLDLVYLSPEMINNSGRVQKVISKLHENEMLARVVVDEAHCVSSWGHDFRPDYKGMKFFKENFPNVPVMALTATASEKVRLDIIHNLQMKDPIMLKQSFNRTNLFYTVMNKPPAIYEWVKDYIMNNHRGETGIIYCHSKQSCETTSQKLNSFGISCMFYHAGMDPEERLDVQLQWQQNKVQLICATIAFGMGIDKPDVRFVIHMYIPRSLEGYYQETGRAGRDGRESRCIMFYSYKDARSLQSLIQRDENLEETARETHLAKLRQVVQYCENKTDCRRRQVLHFFNETFDAKNCLKKCDNCCSNVMSITKDVTNHCINIIKMVQLIQGDKVTVLHCQDVYKGSKTKKIVTLGHSDIEYHGLGKDLDRGDIERIIFELQSLNALNEYQIMRGGFASTYVRLGPDANVIMKGRKKISLAFAQSNKSNTGNSSGPKLTASGNGSGLENFKYTDSFVSARQYRYQLELEKENVNWASSSTKAALQHDLINDSISDLNSESAALNELRSLRQQILAEKGFARPVYYVSDALLKEMAEKLPTNARDFSKLSQVVKGQTSCFGDFKKLLASLARARKNGMSQDSSKLSISQTSQYFQQQTTKRSHKSLGISYSKSKSQYFSRSQKSRATPASKPKQSSSTYVRQMPI